MKYPIQITGVSHKGKKKTWVIHSQEHLEALIDKAALGSDCQADNLLDFLAWLEKDLKHLYIKEI